MLRPAINKINNNEDIILQLNDWRSYDVIDDDYNEEDEDDETPSFLKKKKFLIKAYGITEQGNSILININGFCPYFFVKMPNGWDKTKVKKFKRYLINNVKQYHKDSITKRGFCILSKIPFYGFTNNTKEKFMRITFKTLSGYYTYLKLLKKSNEEPIIIDNIEYDFSKLLYETKVSPLLRFFHVKNIKPVGWIKLPSRSYKIVKNKTSRCQIECDIFYNNIERYNLDKIGKFIVASYDIECTSCDGTFPNANRPDDEIIQIGTTINIFGEEKKYKYIATLKKCDPIEGAIVEEFENEKKLLFGWAKFMQDIDPDIITGYNIWGFDWEYIYNRAKTGNGGKVSPYHDALLKKLCRTKPDPRDTWKLRVVDYVEKELQSSALGQNFLRYIDIEGIVQVDLYKLIQKDYKLTSYKLDAVSKHFMKQQKEDLSPQELFRNYRRGTSADMKEIAVYCIKDCALCNDLLNKLQVIPNNVGMGNVCCIPFSYLFLRGQGIKIFSLVAKQCREEGFLIKDLHDEDIDKNSYEGAIVFVPEPGIYFDPVAVMDYASLYPSSMIAENISHDSLLGFKEYQLDKDSKKKDDYILIKDTINNKYDNLDDYNYTDIEYDIYQGVGDEKKKIGYKVCRYSEKKTGEKSVLPRILMDLLKARKDTRKRMKYKTAYCKDGREISGMYSEKDDTYILTRIDGTKDIIKKDEVNEVKDTFSYFQKAVLDGQQLAFKVTCNSLYGQVGASTSSICCKELAASTTATGRKMVIVARDYTLEKYEGSKLVYGDTDSVFINFTDYIKKKYSKNYENNIIPDRELMKLTIQVGEEAGAHVTSKLKHPQNLEYEKVFWPFIIFSKKRYVGNKYEFSPDKFKQTSMGIVLKRRDNAPIVKDIYGGIIDYILNKRNIEGSYEFFRERVKDLLDGKVDIERLIISKSLRANYSNPTLIPHKVLADRMGERDPGNKPQSNERVPYCYIDNCNIKCTICNTKVNPTNCKCVKCMQMFCPFHMKNHKSICKNVCRFCKMPEVKLNNGKMSIKRCPTCFGYYCPKCFDKHMTRKDKYKKIHKDKCKKPLSTKLIQGDIVEEPKYIVEKKLKIDYKYYLDHQIEKPVLQIFSLTMDKPEKLIEDILRKFNNKKTGNNSITNWFKVIKNKNGDKKKKVKEI